MRRFTVLWIIALLALITLGVVSYLNTIASRQNLPLPPTQSLPPRDDQAGEVSTIPLVLQFSPATLTPVAPSPLPSATMPPSATPTRSLALEHPQVAENTLLYSTWKELFLVNMDGSLQSISKDSCPPAQTTNILGRWSADGSFIAFTCKDIHGRASAFLYDVRASSARLLERGIGIAFAWSPSNDAVLMNVYKEQINPITYLVDATTGITHTLSAAAAWQGQGYSAMRQGFIPGDWYPSDIALMAWSPDGQQIAINATGALYLFDASDLRINKQFNNGFMSQPQWSADGHTIFIGQYVLREGTPTSLSPSSQMPGTQSVQLDIDTGAMQPLDRDFTIPSWSPDRRQFVTATYSGQSLNLYSANGDFVRELSVGGFISYFLWSSDSKEIVAFVSVNPALTRVVRIRMSGEIQTITDEHVAGGMIESNAAWRSPDDALFAIPLEVASEPRIGIFDGQGHEWMVLNGMVVIGWRPHT